MVDVAIIGAGMTPVGEHWDKGLRELAVEATSAALDDAGDLKIDAIYVGNAYGPTISGQSHVGVIVAEAAGLAGVEAFTIESGDASGGAALRLAYLAVASGQVETALVVGVEKGTDAIAGARTEARSVSLDADYEAIHGTTLTAQAALLMRRYMHEYGVELAAFEGFSINAHTNGKRNALAMYRNTVREGAFAKAPMVASPVNLFDGAPDADGAAAVILTSEEKAADMVSQPIKIVGSGAATDTLAIQNRRNPLVLNAVSQSTRRAMAQANITHNDIDLFELHDAFTILSVLSLEAAYFANPGMGWQLANAIGLDGSIPISTFGGLKSRGNPAGATGIYQAVEAVNQLRGTAGDNQVADAQTAMIQNIGGMASSVVTHIIQTL